jgi:hypothetical protein
VNLSIRKTGSAAVIALALASIMVGPVAASTPPTSDYGNTVTCRYTAPGDGPSFNFKLRKFVVTAPVLYAKHGTQTVGWRFVVTRSMNNENGPYDQTYKSPVQKASATESSAAAFSTMKVGVNLPDVENLTQVSYHVTLKLFWYRANGSVQSRVSYLMPYMVQWTKFDDGYWDNDCPGGFYQGP